MLIGRSPDGGGHRASWRVPRSALIAAASCAILIACPGRSCAQWTVAGCLGAAHTRPAALTINQPDDTTLTFVHVPFRGESLSPPLYYAYRVGRQVHGRVLSVEAELIHAKAYADLDRAGAGSGRMNGQQVHGARALDLVQQFAMSHGLNFLFVNAVARWPLADSRLHVVMRAGGGPAIPHVEAAVRGETREGYQLAGIGLQAAAGLEVRLWRALYASGEYKFTSARPRVDVPGGTATFSTQAHHVAVGATIRLDR